ncbi:CdaR family transcriptional regulator [Rhodococcus erythropolis]|jgi:DNA-binding PucR family transcriptional regulator|uniref:PucR family transcriptional regulator n=1 Tax=Rhodococcus erythropolis TaxID=1833 RepID=UPI0009FCD537|nr:helix-turn-helix domain-containing protein [Rhodococcus erythropolis]ORI21321.1 CdaR family transcriptional regulator [Rhodococcus erythropolis]
METSELDGWIANLAPIYLQPEVIDGFVQRIDDAIAEANPEVAADRELRRDVDASTAAQLRVIVAAIAGGSQVVTPPAESVALALTVARRGMDLRVLLKIYGAGRLAMLGFVDESIEALPIGPELKRALLVRVWGSAMRWLEVTTELLVATYAKERESLARGAFARRSETVHAIVAGEALHSDEASRILDYPMRRHHTAFVLWTDDTDPAADVLARLDSYARTFVDESNGERVLTLPSGARELWSWVAHFDGQEWASHVDARHSDLRVAVGASGYGMEGFARSHREALAAQRVAVRSGGSPGITVYEDVQVPCLLTEDLGELRELVARELKGLAGADGVTTRIRDTVRVYYENNCTAAATAAALGLHKNTVRYRLDQAEKLLGRSVDQRRLPTELALIALESYGATIAPAP